MLTQLDVFDDPEPRAAALNMAIDEALLEGAEIPILRFYRWIRPAISFGYFGLYAEAIETARGREIVRRWTGGGIVPHGEDLTYSMIIPATDPFFRNSSPEIYRRIHQAISKALRANGITASLADNAAPRTSDHCFSNPVRADLISDGQKIAGAAHRRTRRALLHQGSIQRSGLPDKFRAELADGFCDQFRGRAIEARLLGRAHEIADAKYATREWFLRR
ncbi:MAG TPA: hypothetical protein VM940_01170 [Chthoniobacterales bacterium]|nr:hypothetical protein [Chthoniobacterales bacterium]